MCPALACCLYKHSFLSRCEYARPVVTSTTSTGSAILATAHFGNQKSSAGCAGKRLRLPATRTSFEQHRTALERLAAGADGGRVCGGGAAQARSRRAT